MVRLLFALRQFLRKEYLNLFGTIAKPSNGVHILNGHYSHRIHPDSSYLDRLLNDLSGMVKFIKIEEAVHLIERRVQPEEPLCAFTFDDGFAECYDTIAPVLEKYGTNAIFFVNPNFVDGDEAYIKEFTEKTTLSPGKSPMRWQQLKDLQNRGFIIGAHTMDHFLTASDDSSALEYQIVECKKVIEERLGKPCDYFAWPYGRLEHTNQKAVELACKTYKYVFSQSDYRHYYSFDGRVINRRHFEPFWPIRHVKYFLSKQKQY